MILLIIFLAALVGGTNTPLVKLNVALFSPALVAFLRFFIAFFLILPFFFLEKLKVKLPTVNLLAVNILFAANILIFVYAVGKTSIIATQTLYLLTSVFVAILGLLILKEKLIKSQIVGLLIAILGLLTLFTSSLNRNDIRSTGTLLGNALTFVAVIDWSLYVVLSRKLSKQFSPLYITTYNFLITALLSLVFVSIGYKQSLFLLSHINTDRALSISALAIFSTVMFFFFYQWVVKHTSAFISTMVNYLGTAFASIAGVIFFHENLTASLFTGILLISFGAYLASTKNYRFTK